MGVGEIGLENITNASSSNYPWSIEEEENIKWNNDLSFAINWGQVKIEWEKIWMFIILLSVNPRLYRESQNECDFSDGI